MDRSGARRSGFSRTALLVVPTVLLLGIASGRLSNSGYGNTWFDALAKPAFMPPGWAFGVAWTALYLLIGLALALIVASGPSPARTRAIGLFVAQFLLNLAWSPLFFAAHRALPALWLIGAILAVAMATAAAFMAIRRTAGWLMLPYLGWLCFAALLNYEIVRLNPGA